MKTFEELKGDEMNGFVIFQQNTDAELFLNCLKDKNPNQLGQFHLAKREPMIIFEGCSSNDVLVLTEMAEKFGAKIKMARHYSALQPTMEENKRSSERQKMSRQYSALQSSDKIEDCYLAESVLECIRAGKEAVHSSSSVRKELGLDD